MITELYVPRPALPAFLTDVRADFRQHGVQLIYGTVRLIEQDVESFLAWAREPWACTVLNLHVDHTAEGIRKAAGDFRRLIDRALEYGGSYFPTYHRWASRAQVEACYPQFPECLQHKRRYDPDEVFQSDGTVTMRECSRIGFDDEQEPSSRRMTSVRIIVSPTGLAAC